MLFLAVFLLLGALFLGALYYGYRLGFYYRDPQVPADVYQADDQILPLRPVIDQCVHDFEAAPWEAVSIRSFDGLTLTGRYIPVKQGGPLLLQMHGYKGNALRDFCGTWPIARELGCNVLLVDQRCHGASQGHTITFGVRERQDCLAWANYASARFPGVPIVLMGVSMGAATVLMASHLDLPAQVCAIAADCPYDAPEHIIRKVLGTEMGLPQKLVYPFIRMGARLFGGFDLEGCTALEAVREAKVPILLLHGDADRFVPFSMSQAIHAAAPDKIQFHPIPGSGHALNQVHDPALYNRLLVTFLERHLPGGSL